MKNKNFSIKPVLNYRIDKSGRQTLILQIIYKRKRGVVFTPYRLLKEELDPKRGIIALDRKHTARDFVKEVNAYISTQSAELCRVIEELESLDKPVKPTDITTLYRCRSDRRYLNTFVNFLIEELMRQEKCGTAANYRSTLASFEKFMGHNRCCLSQIDNPLLVAFVGYLRRIPVQSNTISFYIRCLRAIYNKARRERLVAAGISPFEAISIREDRTRKLAVSPLVMKNIARRCLQEPHHTLARDLFLFSFYARGMSFVDIAYLQCAQIRGGFIYYSRRKTGQPFSVKIIEPMTEIINHYLGATPWVFPLMVDAQGAPLQPLESESKAEYAQRLHKRYKVALSQYSQSLGDISKQLNLDERLSFNVARHTWASLARVRGIPVSVISGGLGHSSEKTTNIYLDDLDTHLIDDANDIITAL